MFILLPSLKHIISLHLLQPPKLLFSSSPQSAALSLCLLQALQSLSLADSRLRQRGTVLVNALGSNACLRKVDLSGNLLDDPGAKMLSKALQINTTLRSVRVWFLNWHRRRRRRSTPCRSEHSITGERRRRKMRNNRGVIGQMKE